MFNFKNITRLFQYNWNSVVKNLLPKGNNTVIDESEYKNINNGAILRIISAILSEVASVGIAIYVVVKAYSWLYGDAIMKYAISEAIKDNLGKWIVDIIIMALIPIAILIYNNIMKKKEQNGWPIFIMLIIVLLQTLYSLYGIIGWLVGIAVNPLFAILGLVCVLFTFLGNVNIAIGCIDFLQKQANIYVNNAQPIQQPYTISNSVSPVPVDNMQQQINQSIQPQDVQTNAVETQYIQPQEIQQQPIQQQPIQQSDQQQVNTPKFCLNCGSPILENSQFCASCGTKL